MANPTVAPPSPPSSPLLWLRQNLFNTWYNSVLTVVCLALIVKVVIGVSQWVMVQAQWAVVVANLRLFLIGRYPVGQSWRMGVVLVVLVLLVALWSLRLAVRNQRRKAQLSYLTYALLPLAACLLLWLIGGGLGLTPVGTNLWGGLMLTLLVALTSTVLAFPLGIVLALGRQSALPVWRWGATLYIELARGLPLLGILFMAQVMLPLVLPAEFRLDRLVRAIAGLVLFNAAYLAENVRGGLQSIPRGQMEAAKALGLNPLLTLLLVVLPQALRISLPGIVGQFISLFKDTSLLSLFALLELTGISRTVLAQPQFQGHYAEVYLFIGLIYWVFCYTLSSLSRRLEHQ